MDMQIATRVSLEEYLNTEYEPDCDYVDGVLEERNVGKNRHSETQSLMVGVLLGLRRQHAGRVLTGQRVQVSPTRVMTKIEDGVLRCADPALEVKLIDVLPEE